MGEEFHRWINSVFFVLTLFFALCGFADFKSFSERKALVLTDFEKKLTSCEHEFFPFSKKSFEYSRQIIIFPDGVDFEKVILSHAEDIFFLTNAPHFIHKHVLVCTFLHGNDIRIKYDPVLDDFFFHSGESVRQMRLLSESDPLLVFDLDYFALWHKRKDPKGIQDDPSFIIFEPPTTLHPSFKRKGDGHFYVEIASGSRDNKPTISGNHNWLRLIDSDGNVTSVGIHPKVSRTQMNTFAHVPVMFYNSDIYEWLDNRTYYSHTFPLLPEEYLSLKEDIEKDMVSVTDKETSFDYSVVEYNCVHWIIEKLSKTFTFHEDEMKFDMYSAIFPSICEYYRKDASDDVKIIITPILHLLQYGIHLPRFISACICGGFVKNDENTHSLSYMKEEFRLFDIDMNLILHPFLFEEYLQKHEKELLEYRYDKVGRKNEGMRYREEEVGISQ